MTTEIDSVMVVRVKMPLHELRAYMLAVGEPRAYMRAVADWC